MLLNGQKINKEEFLAIKSEITDEGIIVSLKGKKYRIDYPKEVWKHYPETKKEALLDNLAFVKTCHLPVANGKKGAVYSTAMPLFETFAFKCTMYDIPSTAHVEKHKTTEFMRDFFNSTFVYSSYDTVIPEPVKKRKSSAKKKTSAVILFTAGKESLLTTALCLELGITPILVYIDEDPDSPETKHKEGIIKTLETEYGIKVHKVVSEVGKLRKADLQGKESSWGFGTMLLGYTLEILPFAEYFDADYIFLGNEYDCDEYAYDSEGFKSSFSYDQRSDWTKQMDVVARMMTNGNTTVGSLVGPLYEMGLLKVLHKRYPALARLQMSCFSDNEEGKDHIWCCNCSKCAWVYAMLKGIGADTEGLGFHKDMFSKEFKKLYSIFDCQDTNEFIYDPHGLGKEEQALAFYMAAKNGETGALIEQFKEMPIYDEIKSNFRKAYNTYFSQYDIIHVPYELKDKLMDIFDETFEGSFAPKDFRLKQTLQMESSEAKEELIKEQ
jgi:hypothetical protein